MVRCGICLKAFNGREQLESDTETEPPLSMETPSAPGQAPEPSPWKDGDNFYIDDNFDLSLLGDGVAVDTPEQGDGANSPPPQPADSDVEPGESPTPAPDAPTANPGSSQAEGTATDSGSLPDTDKPTVETPPETPVTEQHGGETLDLKTDDMARWQPEPATLIHPEISPRPQKEMKGRQWLWTAGSLLALATLCTQLIYFNSLAIDRKSLLWPLAESLCSALDCPLVANSDRSRIITRDLVIRTHPDVANALVVDAQIINTARFDQPYPPLALVFEDLQGNIVASRTFAPAEYLGAGWAGTKMMARGQPVKLEIEIADPGREAVSFTLSVPRE